MILNAATSSWPHPESEPQRVAILAAADRLLTGTPERSTGNLSISQLAIEADIRYWIVAQKHTDLRDHFQQLAAKSRQAAQVARSRSLDPFARLQREHQELKDHCARLEDLVRTYAVVINELSLENEANRDQTQRGHVTRLETPHARSI